MKSSCLSGATVRREREPFGRRLIDEALSLAEFPERGRGVSELADPDVREIVHGSYRIIYELLGEPFAVYILRFWHASRGVPERGPRE